MIVMMIMIVMMMIIHVNDNDGDGYDDNDDDIDDNDNNGHRSEDVFYSMEFILHAESMSDKTTLRALSLSYRTAV